MSIKKVLKSKKVTSFLFALVFLFIFFIGINKSMAVMYSGNSTVMLEGDIWAGGTGDVITCSTGQILIRGICKTPTFISPGVAPIPPPARVGSPWYYVYSWDAYWVCWDDTENSCVWTEMPAGSVTLATFAVNTDKLTYAPSEVVILSLAGAAGDQGSTFSGFSGIVNDTLCFFFGCSAPKGIEVDTNFAGLSVAHCSGSGSCSNGAGQTFTAPATPGTYTILLTGCYAYFNGCYAHTGQLDGTISSSITFDVVAPSQPLPSVNVWLGTFNEVKYYFKNLFSKSKNLNLVG
ncbi:TPA: hypothetical protein DEP94_03565 [Candidatus Nomurabacteria bacterium]|nr:hypothetical protein [Candidatus Nomurabacteria bacterium]